MIKMEANNNKSFETICNIEGYQVFSFKRNENIKSIDPVIFCLLYICGIAVTFFLIAASWLFRTPGNIDLILWLAYIVVGFAVTIDLIKQGTWDGQIGFVKEGNTYWAVKLCYTPKALEKCIRQKEKNMNNKEYLQLLETKQQTILENEYIKGIQGIQGKREWYGDGDKNFLICNGRKAEGSVGIIRLDDAEVILNTKKWLIIRYKNYRKRYRNLRISNSYPELAESITQATTDNYSYTCPRADEKINRSGDIVLKVIYAMILAGMALIFIV